MSTKVIGILLAIVVIAGGAYYFTKSDSLSEGLRDGATDKRATDTTGSPMSLKELIVAGIAKQCTFSDESSGAQTSGTVYVGGSKVRGDFSVISQGKTMGMHMISDGATMHTWIDGMADGFKMSMTASHSAGDTQQGFDADKKINYHCSPWATDDSKFVLPSGVTFRDMAAMMKGMMQ